MSYRTIIVTVDAGVATLQLNRPDALNALSSEMLSEVQPVIEGWDRDADVRAIVITGSDKAFAAGADITEMVDIDRMDALAQDFLEGWNCIARCRTPTIAAVAGHALGGGCEIAMMCDIMLAADNARFGQPEIRLGTIPGLGGTQRLTRRVGSALAMDLCLTGRTIGAEEALRAGLVSRVLPLAELRSTAQAVAATIAGYSAPVAGLVCECIDVAGATTPELGQLHERRAFHSLFGSDDQREGMRAFLEKRTPGFTR